MIGQAAKIPFFLVTGFLGAGKTSFLKRVLNSFADHKRLAIIQNEFAPASIDGIDLQQTDKPFEILEINKGSVFCVCLLSDFVLSLAEFVAEHQPDALFLEASGLADPVSIAQMLESPRLQEHLYLSHIWCLIDLPNYQRIKGLQVRVEHQIQIADTLILNKKDRFSGNLSDIKDHLAKLNPYAKMLLTSFADIAIDDLFEKESNPLVLRQKDKYSGLESKARPEHVKVKILKTARLIRPEDFHAFLATIPDGLLRMKGFLQTTTSDCYALQYIYGQTDYKCIESYPSPTLLIAMGNEFAINELSDLFRKYWQR